MGGLCSEANPTIQHLLAEGKKRYLKKIVFDFDIVRVSNGNNFLGGSTKRVVAPTFWWNYDFFYNCTLT